MLGATLAQGSAWSEISWIDWTAAIVLLVFLVAGLFRGVVWQLTRAAVLVLAYLVAIVTGPAVADVARGLLSVEHERAHAYLSFVVVFVGVIVAVGLIVWLLQRAGERTPLSAGSRLLGGALGLVTGALIVLAFLTGVQMFYDWTGSGGRVARAATESNAQAVGQDALRLAGRALPETWASRTENWRELLGDPELEPRGTFRPLPTSPAKDGKPETREGR